MSKNQINKDVLAFGGGNGGIIADGSVSTSISTGLNAVWIEVLSDTTFSTLTGWNALTATVYDGLGVNVPTSVATKAGARLGFPFEGYWTAISHSGGQIAHYSKIND